MKLTAMNNCLIKPLASLKPRLTLLAVLLALTATSTTSRAAALAHWTFDELSGTVANDSVGLFDGNLSPSGAAFVSGGISGNALSLSQAANGFVTIGNVLGLTSGNFSIVAWVKMNVGDSTSDTVVVSKHQAFSLNGYILGVNSIGGGGLANKAMFYEGSVGGSPVSTTTVNDGNWHQLVSVYQAGGTKAIYVDGAPAESIKASEQFIGNSSPFMIGGSGGIPTGKYTGKIDEVQIYDQVLTDSQINFLFLNPSLVVPEPGTAALMGVGVFTAMIWRAGLPKRSFAA